MLSKFRFISNDFELPMLDHNENWITNPWVYCITGILGAIGGIAAFRLMMMGDSFGEVFSALVFFGACIVPPIWAGCTATAFFEITETKYAFRRCIFTFFVLWLTFFVCAALSIIAIIVLCIMIVSLLLAAGSGGGRRSKSSSDSGPDTVYDENGNTHYVSSSSGSDRVTTTDGRTMRREADGTYRDLH